MDEDKESADRWLMLITIAVAVIGILGYVGIVVATAVLFNKC